MRRYRVWVGGTFIYNFDIYGRFRRRAKIGKRNVLPFEPDTDGIYIFLSLSLSGVNERFHKKIKLVTNKLVGVNE